MAGMVKAPGNVREMCCGISWDVKFIYGGVNVATCESMSWIVLLKNCYNSRNEVKYHKNKSQVSYKLQKWLFWRTSQRQSVYALLNSNKVGEFFICDLLHTCDKITKQSLRPPLQHQTRI
jgi:hypothetical protein